jgi:hypothetical protein
MPDAEQTFNDHVSDLNGDSVYVGDRIAGAFRAGDVAELRTGRVLGFGVRSGRPTVKVQWELKSGNSGGARPTSTLGQIEARLLRFVKIGA